MSVASLIVLGCLIAALVGFLGILSALETACISLESRRISGDPVRDTALPPVAGRRLPSPEGPVIHVIFVSTVLRLATAILSVAFPHGLCGLLGTPFAPMAVVWFSAIIVLGDVLPKMIASGFGGQAVGAPVPRTSHATQSARGAPAPPEADRRQYMKLLWQSR